MNFSFQSALRLNQIIEERSKCYTSDVKCHFFYTPKTLFSLTQRKIRTSLKQRQDLRKKLLNTLLNEGINLCQKQKEDLCNTQLIPTLSHGSISISHCPHLKGFIYTLPTSYLKDIQTKHQKSIYQKASSRRRRFEKNAHHIGLDVEVTSRVKAHHVGFLSKKVELDKMPNPSCLWTAKEASFKCLHPTKLPISQVTIDHWTALSNNFFDFHFSTSHKLYGRGYCLLWKQWTIAFATASKYQD